MTLFFGFMIPMALVVIGVWGAAAVNGTGLLIGILVLDLLCTIFVVGLTIRFLSR